MRKTMIILALACIFSSGCYVMEYRYDPYYDGYYGSRSYYGYPSVRYYSPIEPLVDLAVLGAAIYSWNHWHPRIHYTPSYGTPRIRR